MSGCCEGRRQGEGVETEPGALGSFPAGAD